MAFRLDPQNEVHKNRATTSYEIGLLGPLDEGFDPTNDNHRSICINLLQEALDRIVRGEGLDKGFVLRDGDVLHGL